jgi:hypothetical protein
MLRLRHAQVALSTAIDPRVWRDFRACVKPRRSKGVGIVLLEFIEAVESPSVVLINGVPRRDEFTWKYLSGMDAGALEAQVVGNYFWRELLLWNGHAPQRSRGSTLVELALARHIGIVNRQNLRVGWRQLAHRILKVAISLYYSGFAVGNHVGDFDLTLL